MFCFYFNGNMIYINKMMFNFGYIFRKFMIWLGGSFLIYFKMIVKSFEKRFVFIFLKGIFKLLYVY